MPATKLLFLFISLFVISCRQINHQHAENKEILSTVSDSKRKVNSIQDSSGIGFIAPVGNMGAARANHTATLLNNGKVLVCGGFAGNTLASAEIYDPASKRFTTIVPMAVARLGHSSTLLPDGKLLIAGGYNGSYLSDTEIYDPQTETFSAGPEMKSPRSGHTAVMLDNGKILFAGGVGVDWSFLESAELYIIQTKTFSSTGAMTTARESHTATRLKNGTVLLTGGHKGRRADITIYSSAEIYNPATEKFIPTSNLTKIHHKHDAIMLADGRVLITGGADERDSKGTYSSAEIYDIATSSFNSVKKMNLNHYKHNGSSILLPNNNVLIAGGANQAELYNPLSGLFTLVPGSMGTLRLFSSATLLPNGQVLITGGYNENMEISETAWLYSYK